MSLKQIVATRQQLYAYFLPKNGVIAELGVGYGHNFFDLIYPLNKPKESHLIDRFKYPYMRNGTKAHLIFSKGKEEKNIKRVTDRAKEIPCNIHIGDTVEVMETFPDNYFDWVYVDGDHTYEGCMRDLEVCRKKVKDDGCIAGHDYEIFKSAKQRRWGVVDAVNEFCEKYDYNLTYLTLGDAERETTSFILEKK